MYCLAIIIACLASPILSDAPNGDGNSFGYGFSNSFAGDGAGGALGGQFPSGLNDLFASFKTLLNQNLQNQAQQFQLIEQLALKAQNGQLGGGNGLDGAAASASIGPGGGFQSAAVYPENPQQPNVFTRFGGSESKNPDQFYGVSSSSFSFSDDTDGKKQNFHQSTSTVNDNGKITTHTVKSP